MNCGWNLSLQVQIWVACGAECFDREIENRLFFLSYMGMNAPLTELHVFLLSGFLIIDVYRRRKKGLSNNFPPETEPTFSLHTMAPPT